MEYYKKALQIEPDQPIAANNLAYLMVEGGQNTDVALYYAQSAAELCRTHRVRRIRLPGCTTPRALMLRRATFWRRLKTAPDDPAIQYHLGMTYSKMSDPPMH